MSEFSIGEKVNARCLNSGVRINKAKLPLFFELDRFIRDIFGYLAPWAVVLVGKPDYSGLASVSWWRRWGGVSW